MQAASSSNTFECPVCNERYNDSDHAPKTLPCGHSYYLLCANEFFVGHEEKSGDTSDAVDKPESINSSRVASSGDACVNSITCPICRNVSEIQSTSLPTNCDILNAMPPLTPPVVVQECNMCRKTKRPVLMHCETCNLHLCLGHSKKHQDHHEDHVLQSTVPSTDSNMCPRHPTKELEFYCDCKKLICSSCCMLDHITHNRLEIQEAFDKLKPSIESATSRSKVVCDEMNVVVDHLKKLERDLSAKETDIVQSIQKSLNKIHVAADSRMEALLSSLPSKRRAIESHRHGIESQSNQLSCSQSSQVHLESGDQINCLSNADPLIELLSSLDDETKSDDWREIKYDNHLSLRCASAAMIRLDNYLDQLDSSNDSIKRLNVAFNELRCDLPQFVAKCCGPIDRNLSIMSWCDVETALAAIVTNYVVGLNQGRSDLPLPGPWIDALFKPFLSEMDRLVREKRTRLKMTWDRIQRNRPCRNELECRMTIIDILKQTRGALTWNGPDDNGNEFNWSDELPLSEWDGLYGLQKRRIVVDGNGMITQLWLTKLGLRGMLSDLIGCLASLTSLGVGDNQLTNIPDTIGNLTSLTVLYVSVNQLTHLPDSIGNLTSLTRLWVNNSPITSTQAGKDEIRRRFERIGLCVFV